ncbi:hypothetical protein NDU88_002530 [Pleurodeles waltl]|uniref:Uncharacterized protein n=1 Tax=Pleurodeles waltl TaxID=8319 RepID=A0AAV7UXW1_PLEWA|nr:hypothetical protein NDU88_002530 [Pleurodeles waltl]
MREVRRLERGYARGAGSEEGRLEWSWGRTVEVVLRCMKIKPEFNPTLCDVITVRVQHNIGDEGSLLNHLRTYAQSTCFKRLQRH